MCWYSLSLVEIIPLHNSIHRLTGRLRDGTDTHVVLIYVLRMAGRLPEIVCGVTDREL